MIYHTGKLAFTALVHAVLIAAEDGDLSGNYIFFVKRSTFLSVFGEYSCSALQLVHGHAGVVEVG